MKPTKLNLGLLANTEIFASIHDTKKQFKELFTEISNGLENSKLTDFYPRNKGVKLGMGNELEKCPYQVLDIFRDFDKSIGHNVRILNWWGHGLYILVFFGKDLAADTLPSQNYFIKHGFNLSKGSSPWDYARILDPSIDRTYAIEIDIEMHLSKFGYLLWYKEIQLEEELNQLKLKVSDELNQIFHFHRI